MPTKNPAENFGNETHDDCEDDARTEQNRAGAPRTDGAQDNVHQRSRETSSDQPPTRDPGTRADK
jgi:hypothetical protein